jgi:8-amino-7-oxononanoate synthase
MLLNNHLENLENQLQHWHTQNLHRQRFAIDEYIAANIIKINQQSLINFSHNDYLCLAAHPFVKQKFIEGAEKYGLGSGASAMVSGYQAPHRLFEEKIAEFLKRDQAILFSSGYLANIGLIASLGNRQSLIVSDKFCHASLLDGIQLSRAKHLRYQHNNLKQAEQLLTSRIDKNTTLLITESIFSMEGDISKLDQLVVIAKKANAILIADDAHAIGVLGETGRGITEYYSLNQHDVPYLVTPLGKALGSMGGIISGKKPLIEAIEQFARTYRYSTALPPAIAYANLAALKVLEEENWRREELWDKIKFFIKEANQRNLPLVSQDLTPIKSILIKDNKQAIKIKELLFNKGFFISCIRPPTVPKNTTRLRISLNCLHEKKDILSLLDIITTAHE